MRILIVEDSETISKILKHLIVQDLGYHVDIAPDMASALTLLEQHQYFVVVADLNLPDASNGDIVRLVLSAYKTPCIVLTSNLDADQRREILKLGIVDYIPKDNRYSYQYVVKLIDRLYRNQQVKVLVVDDSVVSRKFVRMLLEHHLFQVIEANDGEAALAILEQEDDIQLLITDYNMPIIDGVELILRVREKYNREDIAIIGLSNDNDESLSAKFIKNGANDFLQKPFVHEEFHCRVLNTLDSLDMMRNLWSKANRDYLTKIYTRLYFFSEHNSKDSENALLSVALLDLDYFKKINDTHGHDVGDQVLIEFAQRLDNAFGSNFTVARFGGEEFVVAFKGLDDIKTTTLMDKFREQCEANPMQTTAGDLVVTFSCGVATRNNETLDQTLQRADELLYQAKTAGRNQVIRAC
ncbi:response regulator [Shewanella inventionis]|uniref:diguanylate cyclase n=1 Tax=Shewanella inventionis TaxID=1738770 RepID=A0ABQ1IU45_9GAMM|nr:response regulator [Shewanella inventionis]MCL1156863.1 response regulator [Shewanella inventionis]GGB51144.1 diguanylate cyclase response regulator [Shewanella inventionis]